MPNLETDKSAQNQNKTPADSMCVVRKGKRTMKVTELRYPSRSSFFAPCQRAIKTLRRDLLEGKIIRIRLSPQGYNQRAIATIEHDNPNFFWIDKKSDPTRFSARIRAAAYILYKNELHGEFEISHKTGVLTIQFLK